MTPARDAAATLPETLASLRAQTFADFEAIVVDDGSTDGTRAVVEAATRDDARFRLLALPANRGVSEARNGGLRAARGRWVLFLDADDWLEPGHLAALVAAVEADPTADGAFGDYRYAGTDGRLGRLLRPRLDGDLFLVAAERSPFPIHACITSREAVLEVGGFDPCLEACEDRDLWLRLGRAGRRFARADAAAAAEAAAAVYRLRPGSATRSLPYLEDALEVTRRAHAPDPRVPSPRPEHAAGRPPGELPVKRARLLLSRMGVGLGVGAGAEEAARRLEPAVLASLSIDTMARWLLDGFHKGAGVLAEDAGDAWVVRESYVAATLDALGVAAEPDLGGALRLGVARLLADGARRREQLPATFGEVHAVRLGRRKSYEAVSVPPGARVLRLYLNGGNGLKVIELPVVGPVVPAPTLVRAVLAAHGIEMARRLLAEGWRRRSILRRLLRLGLRPRGRRFARHLLGLAREERRPALDAFVAASLPWLLPALTTARTRPATTAGNGTCRAPSRPDDRVERWEQVFAAEDPWGYGSRYEQVKYAHTLELLPPGEIGRALELACAEGHFTVQLAPRVRDLLATDISPTALSRVAERCAAAGAPNVRFAPLDFAREPLPEGPFGLIVCSEVLYYLKDRRELARVARKVADALEPGGLFVTAHARLVVDEPRSTGFDWLHGFGAATILATFGEVPDLDLVRELRTPLYRVGLFRKRETPRLGGGLARPPEVVEREASRPEDPAVAGRIVRGGADLTLRDAQGTLVTRTLPILMYHRIAADGPAPLATWRVHPERFEAQLDWLKRNGFRSVGLDAWQRAVERGFGELKGRAVCITFDDGYEDFAETAWPLLRSYGFGATVFLVSDLVGRVAAWDAAAGPPAPLMDWPTLARLRGEGVAFGAHTATHPALTRVGPGRVADELHRSKARLEEGLGSPFTTLAYPFGFVDSIVRNTADAAAYAVAVTTRHRRARYGDDPLLLPRLKVAGEDGLAAFVRMLDVREKATPLRRLRHARARWRGAPG